MYQLKLLFKNYLYILQWPEREWVTISSAHVNPAREMVGLANSKVTIVWLLAVWQCFRV